LRDQLHGLHLARRVLDTRRRTLGHLLGHMATHTRLAHSHLEAAVLGSASSERLQRQGRAVFETWQVLIPARPARQISLQLADLGAPSAGVGRMRGVAARALRDTCPQCKDGIHRMSRHEARSWARRAGELMA
jgi:hypothetical protein